MNNMDMRVNMNNADTVKCDSCESISFEQVYGIKKLSSLTSPTGEEMYVPTPTFRCLDCKHINEGFKD